MQKKHHVMFVAKELDFLVLIVNAEKYFVALIDIMINIIVHLTMPVQPKIN